MSTKKLHKQSKSEEVKFSEKEDPTQEEILLTVNGTAGQHLTVNDQKDLNAQSLEEAGSMPVKKSINFQPDQSGAKPSTNPHQTRSLTRQSPSVSKTESEISILSSEDSGVVTFKTNQSMNEKLKSATQKQIQICTEQLIELLPLAAESQEFSLLMSKIAKLQTIEKLLDENEQRQENVTSVQVHTPHTHTQTQVPQVQVKQERQLTIKDFPKDLPQYRKGMNPKVFLKAITSHCRLYAVPQQHWLNHLAAAMPYDDREWCTTDFLSETPTTWDEGTTRWTTQYTREGDLDLAKNILEGLREGNDLASFLREFALWWPSANPDGELDGEVARADVLRKLDSNTPYYGHIKDAAKQVGAPKTFLALRTLCLSKQESYGTRKIQSNFRNNNNIKHNNTFQTPQSSCPLHPGAKHSARDCLGLTARSASPTSPPSSQNPWLRRLRNVNAVTKNVCKIHPTSNHTDDECKAQQKSQSPSQLSQQSKTTVVRHARAVVAKSADRSVKFASTTDVDLSKVTCYKCQLLGHYSGSCPNAAKSRHVRTVNSIRSRKENRIEPTIEATCNLIESFDVVDTHLDTFPNVVGSSGLSADGVVKPCEPIPGFPSKPSTAADITFLHSFLPKLEKTSWADLCMGPAKITTFTSTQHNRYKHMDALLKLTSSHHEIDKESFERFEEAPKKLSKKVSSTNPQKISEICTDPVVDENLQSNSITDSSVDPAIFTGGRFIDADFLNQIFDCDGHGDIQLSQNFDLGDHKHDGYEQEPPTLRRVNMISRSNNLSSLTATTLHANGSIATCVTEAGYSRSALGSDDWARLAEVYIAKYMRGEDVTIDPSLFPTTSSFRTALLQRAVNSLALPRYYTMTATAVSAAISMRKDAVNAIMDEHERKHGKESSRYSNAFVTNTATEPQRLISNISSSLSTLTAFQTNGVANCAQLRRDWPTTAEKILLDCLLGVNAVRIELIQFDSVDDFRGALMTRSRDLSFIPTDQFDELSLNDVAEYLNERKEVAIEIGEFVSSNVNLSLATGFTYTPPIRARSRVALLVGYPIATWVDPTPLPTESNIDQWLDKLRLLSAQVNLLQDVTEQRLTDLENAWQDQYHSRRQASRQGHSHLDKLVVCSLIQNAKGPSSSNLQVGQDEDMSHVLLPHLWTRLRNLDARHASTAGIVQKLWQAIRMRRMIVHSPHITHTASDKPVRTFEMYPTHNTHARDEGYMRRNATFEPLTGKLRTTIQFMHMTNTMTHQCCRA